MKKKYMFEGYKTFGTRTAILIISSAEPAVIEIHCGDCA